MKRPIITLEDGTEVLSTTGDVDAFEHGGGVMFRPPRCREFFWSFWSARTFGDKTYRVFTAPVPEDVLAHFEPDTAELALVSGMDKRELKRLGRSRRPDDRLQVVMLICECSGPSRVDPTHEPVVMSPWELAERWGAVFANESADVPMVDYEDFIVRETVHGDYECGRVDGTYLGRYETYRDSLCVVADAMHQLACTHSNVYHEHEKGKLELIVWEPETFTGKVKKRRAKLPESRWRSQMKRYVTNEIIRKGVNKKTESVSRGRQRAATKIAQQKRIQRARDIRAEVESAYDQRRRG